MVGQTYTWTGKGVVERDWLIIGWVNKPDLQYLAFAERKPRQNLFLTHYLNLAGII